MKKPIAVFVSLGLMTVVQLGAVQFDLSPAGTDVAVGLSTLNQVPGLTNSTGSGNEVSGGINFDTNTLTLTLAVGYGSVTGFSNLTAAAFALRIHGPAGPGTNGPVVVDLAPYLFTQGDPALGGLIFGQVSIPTNQVANLLAGLDYINILTTNNPAGEIRAQLIPLGNNAPVVACPEPSTVECGGPITIASSVSDPEGDALVVVWFVNGTVIQTNELAAGSTTMPVAVPLVAEFPLGTNLVSLVVTDSAGNKTVCSTTVTVVDTIPPSIISVTSTPNVLWPPNHKMIAVRLTAMVRDLCGGTSWKITGISSSEAVNDKGSGNTAPDWEITGLHTAKLRAERSGITGPRFYTITVVATDGAGNESQPRTVTVTVPHDQSGSGTK